MRREPVTLMLATLLLVCALVAAVTALLLHGDAADGTGTERRALMLHPAVVAEIEALAPPWLPAEQRRAWAREHAGRVGADDCATCPRR